MRQWRREIVFLVFLLLFFLTLPAQAIEIPIDVLVFFETMDGPGGAAVKTLVGIEPDQSNRIRIGFYEGIAAGSGSMWRASGWMAAVISTYILGVDLADYTIYFDYSGRIDGPSAGGLMTVALLAGLQNHQLNPEATMTGTINPDGSIGPVGGIAYKIHGAARAGKSRVLIPMGKRFELVGEDSIDLILLGNELGVEVLEVGDIYEAYYYLTGEELYRPTLSLYHRLSIPTEADLRIQAVYNQRESEVVDLLQGVSQDINPYIYQLAVTDLEAANKLKRQGLIGAAYNTMGGVAIYTQSLLIQQEVFSFLEERGWDYTEEYLLNKYQGINGVLAFLDELSHLEPHTLSDVIPFCEGYGYAIKAFGSYLLGDMAMDEALLAVDELSRLGTRAQNEHIESAFYAILESALFFHLGDLLLQMALDFFEIGLGYCSLPPPEPAAVENLANMLYTASEASMEYMDRSVLDIMAQSMGIHTENFRWILMSNDYFYSLTYANYLALKVLGDRISIYGLLGGTSALFYDMASIIVKYYSLDANISDVGSIESIGNEPSLRHMLSLAENRARESIAEAMDLGIMPVMSLMMIDAALGVGPRDWDEELDSLNLLWKAGFLARTLTLLYDHQQDTLPAEPIIPEPPSQILKEIPTPTIIPSDTSWIPSSRIGVLGPDDEMFQDGTYYHVYEVSCKQGERVSVTLYSEDFYPYLLFLDYDGNVLGEEGPREEREAYLEIHPQTTGTYLIVVNTYYGGEKGEYTLSITGGEFMVP